MKHVEIFFEILNFTDFSQSLAGYVSNMAGIL